MKLTNRSDQIKIIISIIMGIPINIRPIIDSVFCLFIPVFMPCIPMIITKIKTNVYI